MSQKSNDAQGAGSGTNTGGQSSDSAAHMVDQMRRLVESVGGIDLPKIPRPIDDGSDRRIPDFTKEN